MKKFMQIYFNRVTLVSYMTIFFMSFILWCNPYLNVFIIFFTMLFAIYGDSYVCEKIKHTAGERCILQKRYNFFK